MSSSSSSISDLSLTIKSMNSVKLSTPSPFKNHQNKTLILRLPQA
jgi:hypothetical protein